MCSSSREIQGSFGKATLAMHHCERNGMQQAQHGHGQERFVDIHKGLGSLPAVSSCQLR